MYWIRRLHELWSDWVYMVGKEGWERGGKYFFRSLLRMPYRHLKFTLFARSLSEPIQANGERGLYEIRSFESADLDFVRKIHLPSEAKLCEKRLKAGHYGLVASLNENAVAYIWLCTDDSLERLKLPMSPDDLLLTDLFTTSEFRGKGIGSELACASLRMAQDMRFKRVLVYILNNNGPSLALWQRKMGAKIIGEIDFKRWGFWRKYRIQEKC